MGTANCGGMLMYLSLTSSPTWWPPSLSTLLNLGSPPHFWHWSISMERTCFTHSISWQQKQYPNIIQDCSCRTVTPSLKKIWMNNLRATTPYVLKIAIYSTQILFIDLDCFQLHVVVIYQGLPYVYVDHFTAIEQRIGPCLGPVIFLGISIFWLTTGPTGLKFSKNFMKTDFIHV